MALDIIVGPSVFESLPYSDWSTETDGFHWTREQHPLVMIDWIPLEQQREVLERCAESPRFCVIGTPTLLSEESDAYLSSLPHGLLQPSAPLVYRSQWWHTGNKGLAKNDKITLWTTPTWQPLIPLPLDNLSGLPPISLIRPDTAEAQAYFDHTPSGPSRSRQGHHLWTDGSKQDTEDAELVGAGLVGFLEEYVTSHFNVGGPATNLRGEMAAVARALQISNPDTPLTIYTDCMAILHAVAQWRRGDFQPRMDDEKHSDILLDILRAIRQRTASTHIVWVAAHIGDPGNEAADREADAGAHAEEQRWALETFPIALYSTISPRFPLLHAATWTPTVDRHASAFVGQFQAEWLRHTSEAISTDFILTPDNGRELLGAVLHEDLPELAIRDLLQARSFCFPTATVVSRNHGGSWNTKCLLCQGAHDTYAHRHMSCTELHGAQHQMHDTISKALLLSLFDSLRTQGTLPPTAELHIGKRVDVLWPDCPSGIADFVPDCIIIIDRNPMDVNGRDPAPSRIIIFEFGRCYTIALQELLQVGLDKRAQYQSLQVFLRRRYPDHEVINTSFILSVLRVLPQRKWIETCTALGLSVAQTSNLQKTGLRALVLAGHQLNNTARSRNEALRAVGNHGEPGRPRTGIG